MKKYKVCTLSEIREKVKIPVTIDSLNLLIIYLDDELYAIENKCGHFGIKLDNAEIYDKSIKCIQHGIIFSLETGENINRTWEECDIINRYKINKENEDIYIEV